MSAIIYASCSECPKYDKEFKTCGHLHAPTQAMIEHPDDRIAPWCPIGDPARCAECHVLTPTYDSFCSMECRNSSLSTGPVPEREPDCHVS